METTNFLGSNGKEGVTVYKPIDVNTIKWIKMMGKDEDLMNLSFMSDSNIYSIHKKKINKCNLFKYCSNNITLLDIKNKNNSLNWKTSVELYSKMRRKIDNIFVYHIVKLNNEGKIFRFNIIQSNLGFIVNGNLLKNKIKMRMF